MKKIIENSVLGMAAAIMLTVGGANAQRTENVPPPRPAPMATPVPARPARGLPPKTWEVPAAPSSPSRDEHSWGVNSEKAIKVEPNINLTLCVTQGNVKVNGWNRSEARVYVEEGSKFGFSVLEKSTKTGNPVWVKVIPVGEKDKYVEGGCIAGGEIEIDLPIGASINIKGRETNTTVDSLRKVGINTIGGDIVLRNISGGISASSGQGGITVGESEGGMILETTTGNILVFEAGASDIGDMFKAKTSSGNISLQKVTHRQIDVGSISGSVAFGGSIPTGGSYEFSTANGSIRLALPADSSCKLAATYGYGVFSTDLPFKMATENLREGPIKSIVGELGAGGDTLLKLSAVHGSITIKKQ